jgi:hypothetical protein
LPPLLPKHPSPPPLPVASHGAPTLPPLPPFLPTPSTPPFPRWIGDDGEEMGPHAAAAAVRGAAAGKRGGACQGVSGTRTLASADVAWRCASVALE